MYREYEDEEILYLVKEDEDYYEIMLKKYEPIIIKICNKYLYVGKKIGYEFDDLKQIANIAIFDAMNSYKNSKDILFYTYVINCIKNKLITELKKHSTNKKKVLNDSISYEKEYDGINLVEFIRDKNALDPLDCLEQEEMKEKYYSFIHSLPFDVALVFEMKSEGFTNQEISKFLKIDQDSIRRSMQFARRRLCLN